MLLNTEPHIQYTKGKPLMLLENKLQMLQMEWNKQRRLLDVAGDLVYYSIVCECLCVSECTLWVIVCQMNVCVYIVVYICFIYSYI